MAAIKQRRGSWFLIQQRELRRSKSVRIKSFGVSQLKTKNAKDIPGRPREVFCLR